MLQLSSSLIHNKKVLSLRTGMPVADIMAPIINPDNLKIEGFYCRDRYSKAELILLCQDIRDTLPQGFVVNDHDVLVEQEDLVRLKKVFESDIQLIGTRVETDDKEKMGKVADFATDLDTMYIQKIYVSRSLLKALSGGQLSVDRSQIIEATSQVVTIRNPLQGTTAAAAATA